MNLRSDADGIIQESLAAVLPDAAVEKALRGHTFGTGRIVLVAVGKAAWQMARAASDELGSRIDRGVVITKYGHIKGDISNIACREAGHPVPDANSFAATQEALDLTEGLTAEDTVLFLLSGGGSALFEKPLIPAEELKDLTEQLLASGADIVAVNTLRKRMSAVKGGRFAEHCAPAQVFTIVLSDILGDPLDMIASGPAYPDASTAEDAHAVVKKYGIRLSTAATKLLDTPLPSELPNVTTHITGSVRELCAAADGIAGIPNVAVFSVGSDGTDGPTDAAGGYVDGGTAAALARERRSAAEALAENDAYPALNDVGGLIVTGPTGTNVNDVSVLLIRG